MIPFVPDGGLRELYDRTLGYQVSRPSPFSIWGQTSIEWLHTLAKVAVAAPGAGGRVRAARARTAPDGRARRGGADRAPAGWRRTGSTSTWSGSCRSCWSPCLGAYRARRDEPEPAAAARARAGGRARLRRLAVPALALLVAGVGGHRCGCRPFSDDSVNDLYVYRTLRRSRCSTASFRTGTCSSSTRRWRRRRSRCRGSLGTGEEAFRSPSPAGRSCSRRRWWCSAAPWPRGPGGPRAGRCWRPRRCRCSAAPCCARTSTSRRWRSCCWRCSLLVAERPRLGLAVLGLAVMTKGFPLVAAPPVLAWLACAHGRRVARSRAALALVGTIAVVGGARDRRVRGRLPRRAQLPGGPPGAGGEHARPPSSTRWTASAWARRRALASHRSDGLEHPAADAVARRAGGRHAGAGGAALAPGRRAARTTAGRWCSPSLGAVAAFACLGRVLSPQFLVWTVPLGALAFALAPARAGAGGGAGHRADADRVPRRSTSSSWTASRCRWRSSACATPCCSRWSRSRSRCATAARGGAAARCAWRGPSPSASTSTAFSHGSSSEVSKRTLVSVRKRSIACSRFTPITPPRGPGHAHVGDVGGAPGQHAERRPWARGCGCPRRRSRGRRGTSRSPPSRWWPRRACPRARGRSRRAASASIASASVKGERTASRKSCPERLITPSRSAVRSRPRCGPRPGLPFGKFAGRTIRSSRSRKP